MHGRSKNSTLKHRASGTRAVHSSTICGNLAIRCPNPKQRPLPRRTMLLTGASRGIGHATVKRFSSAGWRVITCSRHPFPEQCPWMMGPEDHLQIDLADPDDTRRAIAEVRRRLDDGRLDALVNNAAISPKGAGRLAARHDRDGTRRLDDRLSGQFLRAADARPQPHEGTRSRARLGGQRDVDCGLAGSSLCRRGLCDFESGARGADPRNGGRFRSARHSRQRHFAGRDRYRHPLSRHRQDRRANSRCAVSARPRRWPRRSIFSARKVRAMSTARKFTSMAASMSEKVCGVS